MSSKSTSLRSVGCACSTTTARRHTDTVRQHRPANRRCVYTSSYARLETDAFAAAGPASASVSLRETRNGWTAGGGIEVALAPNWSAKLEYLYFDFGRHTTTWISPGALPSIVDDARLTMNVVRAGVNYRF